MQKLASSGMFFMLCGSLMASVAICAEAQVACPKRSQGAQVYASSIFENGLIKFENSGDKNNPLAAVLYRGKGQCTKEVIDKYDDVGALPVVGAVFPYTVQGKKALFVIMTWATDHSGLGIKGTSYQVYAYQDDGHGGLRSNDAIANSNDMFGIEGMDNFEESHFYGKTPEEVKELVGRLGLK